jgi:hypothetical protein
MSGEARMSVGEFASEVVSRSQSRVDHRGVL